MIDPRLLLLSPADNRLVVRQPIAAGDMLRIGAAEIRCQVGLPLGHTIAMTAIAVGCAAIKYGAVIGVNDQARRRR